MEVRFDEEENSPGSPSFDTPRALYYDGLERLVDVNEINRVDGQRQEYSTSFSYDPLDNLVRSVDTQGNSKAMTYNGLSRKRRDDDPERHTTLYNYDDVGNLRETQDGRGKIVR